MDALQAGISAAREGRRAEAQALLQQAVQANPRSEQGWLWMSAVVETDDERRTCLERVLTINPHNQTAKIGLERLISPQSPGDGMERYFPIPRSAQSGAGAPRSAAAPSAPADPLALPPAPHSMPTLGMEPVLSGSRPIRRLTPEPADGLAQLRAAQFQPSAPAAQSASSESDPFMALVLIGGLSLTAVAGALILGVLWLIGWPPQ
jgi:hypothetical protein